MEGFIWNLQRRQSDVKQLNEKTWQENPCTQGYGVPSAHKQMFKTLGIVLWVLMLVNPVGAIGVYEQPAEFISKSFKGDPPEPNVIYLKGEVKRSVKNILGHKYSKIRIRYWLKQGRSAWILEEIGKERPITTGIVISGESIEHVKVLIFRESRGWEVRHDFFTEQFLHAKLNSKGYLDRQIDGITGATLSVRAVTNLARMALFLHNQVIQGDA
jgi:FMN-binding domain